MAFHSKAVVHRKGGVGIPIITYVCQTFSKEEVSPDVVRAVVEFHENFIPDTTTYVLAFLWRTKAGSQVVDMWLHEQDPDEAWHSSQCMQWTILVLEEGGPTTDHKMGCGNTSRVAGLEERWRIYGDDLIGFIDGPRPTLDPDLVFIPV